MQPESIFGQGDFVVDAGFWDFCSTVKEAIIGSQSHCDAFRQGRCMSELTLFFQGQSKVE